MKLKTWFLAVASLMAVATVAFAEDYPTRPVKLLVGYGPGGASDIFARVLAQQLSEILKQPFIVENRPGASGTMAAAQTAKATADGYTLFVNDISQFAITPLIMEKLPYDSRTAFTPIADGVGVPMALVANPGTGFKTLADLVRYAKANPGKLNYGSPGVGSAHHIGMEVLCKDFGIVLTHIPYKGASQYIPAVLTGEVQVALTSFASALSYAKSGRFVLLAATSEQRFSSAPDVPSVSESYKGSEFSMGLGVMAPKGVSPEIVSKLSGAIKTALETPAAKERLLSIGLVPSWLSSQDYAEYITRNLDKYKRWLEELHLALNH